MGVDNLLLELGNYRDLVKDADRLDSLWDCGFMAELSGMNGQPPSSNDADQYLNKMTNDVASGQNIARYVVLEGEGQSTELMVN